MIDCNVQLTWDDARVPFIVKNRLQTTEQSNSKLPRQPTVTEEFVFFTDYSTMPAIMMATDPGGGRPFNG